MAPGVLVGSLLKEFLTWSVSHQHGCCWETCFLFVLTFWLIVVHWLKSKSTSLLKKYVAALPTTTKNVGSSVNLSSHRWLPQGSHPWLRITMSVVLRMVAKPISQPKILGAIRFPNVNNNHGFKVVQDFAHPQWVTSAVNRFLRVFEDCSVFLSRWFSLFVCMCLKMAQRVFHGVFLLCESRFVSWKSGCF